MTAEALMALPVNDVDRLRESLNKGKIGAERGEHAECAYCGSPVYIARNRGPKPHFQHYKGGDQNCPWHTEAKAVNERAAQYHGQQESPEHRTTCDLIADLLSADPRIKEPVLREQRIYEGDGENYRVPDILVRTEEDFPSLAIECQHSGTFPLELAARNNFYQTNRTRLIWVIPYWAIAYFGTEEKLPSSYREIVTSHRRNAFCLTPEAVHASRERKTLVLAASHVMANGAFSPFELVPIDAITFPTGAAAYYKDAMIAPRLDSVRRRRQGIVESLLMWDGLSMPPVPVLHELQHFGITDDRSRRLASHLIAACLTIMAEAEGHPRNYIYPGKNLDTKAALNNLLNRSSPENSISHAANLLAAFIDRTTARHLLKRDSTVKKKIDAARLKTPEQLGDDTREARLLFDLFPEALNSHFREMLNHHREMPSWVIAYDGYGSKPPAI